jgi:exodeoxyribonuclease III
MKIIAWNINGIRAILKKTNLIDLINYENPDIFCLSETKISCPFDNIKEEMKNKLKENYNQYWSPCKIKKGYSGTCIFSKTEPIKINNEFDEEGRVIICHYKKFILVHVYTPNSGEALKRLNYRVEEWDIKFKELILKLQEEKPVIVCGDLNVARHEIDLKNPKTNLQTAGFTLKERESFDIILNETKLIDSFRFLHSTLEKYSYWSYRCSCRSKNIGWRIDYFLIDKKLIKKIKKSDILDNIIGSDHAPIILEISIK